MNPSKVKSDYKPKLGLSTHLPSINLQHIKGFGLGLALVLIIGNGYSLAKDLFSANEAISNSQNETLALESLTSSNAATLIEEELSPELEWVEYTVKHGDNLANIFNIHNIPAKALGEILSIKSIAKHLTRLYPGQKLKIFQDPQGEFVALDQPLDNFETLHIYKDDNGAFQSEIISTEVETRLAYGGATIDDSLFLAGKRAKLDDRLIMELADIFAYDIDFALDIRPQDKFRVLFEEKFVEGEKVGVGHILAAEFVNNNRTYHAIAYTGENGKRDYYDKEGKSLKKAFIRTPVKYTRISSHFNLGRKHPILHKIRAHKGVDYAAPRGTPVKASGEGKVTFVGVKGGYGNVVEIQHGPKYSTLYAHLSHFSKTIKKGSRVKQGQVIAYVGSSGLATGPHLHYEFRVNGNHRNPLTVALPKAEGINSQEKSKFFMHAQNMLGLIDHHERIMVAQSEL